LVPTALLACALARRASALEPSVFGEPVTLDVTEASTLSYNSDNRDSRPNQVATRANDDWGVFYNRLNLIGSHGAWRIGLRVDQAWFFRSPNPTEIGLELWRSRPPAAGAAPAPVYFRQKVNEAGVELSNRYINWVYPAKYFVSYESPEVSVTLGDGYAQFGRGLVLSLRKLDELASDSTLRGARFSGRARTAHMDLSLTVLAGELNPLRIDAASGRYLGVNSSALPGVLGVLEAGMPRAVATDFAPDTGNCATFATCSYAPDRLAGAQILLKHGTTTFGLQSSLLSRTTPLTDDVVHGSRQISTDSASLELADLGGHGAAYLELALQDLSQRDPSPPLDPGYAAYASVSLEQGALSLLAEGKHYRRFFPLYANVSTLRAREFGLTAASAPPTTEALFTDSEFEGFNTCVSGGRLRGDVTLSRALSAYAWAGYYQSYAESVANDACVVARENENDVWDSRDHRSKADLSVGTRFDSTPRDLSSQPGATSHVFYRELYARHQVRVALGGPLSLQLEGWHRRRHQTVGGPVAPWSEGDELVGLDVAPKLFFAAGFSYDTNPAVPPTYLNGQVGYHLSSDSTLSLFVGQRRGALRCVGGVCRVFPPFEGASLDAVVRF
jgi:hypothetical protein